MKIKCMKTMPKIKPKCTQSNEHLMLWRICRQRPLWFHLTCKFAVVFVENVCERLCQLFIWYFGGFDGIMDGTRVWKCVFIWNICYFFPFVTEERKQSQLIMSYRIECFYKNKSVSEKLRISFKYMRIKYWLSQS